MYQPSLDHLSPKIAQELESIAPGVSISNLNAWYGTAKVLDNVNLELPGGSVSAFIGPSGCGKSTMLRSINRLNDRIASFRLEGSIRVGSTNPYDRSTDLLRLRREVGIVFQKPNPFPKSIFDNVALGLKAHYGLRGQELHDRVEHALRDAGLWDEVKDQLKKSGLALSGGQQQRLCIARALAVDPRVLLMDEPCSALDPISTKNIEDLILKIGKSRTVVVVTHNLQQAHRISEFTSFFMYGKVEESGQTAEIFENPKNASTRDYISGTFG